MNSQYVITSENIATTTTNLLSDTVTRDLLDTLVKRLDSKVLENIVWNIIYDNLPSFQQNKYFKS